MENNCNYCVNGLIKFKTLDYVKCYQYLEQHNIDTIHSGVGHDFRALCQVALLIAKNNNEDTKQFYHNVEYICEDINCKFHPKCPRRQEFLNSLKF